MNSWNRSTPFRLPRTILAAMWSGVIQVPGWLIDSLADHVEGTTRGL